MNKKAQTTLEFDQIRTRLADRATSAPGRALCLALEPSDDADVIRRMQEETGAALARIFRRAAPSFGSVTDLSEPLTRLSVGSPLGAEELLRIAALLENAARAKTYGKHEDEDAQADCLDPIFDLLEPLSMLSSEIRRCIISADEISSDASPALRQIRRSIKQNADRVKSQIYELMNGSLRNYLQDAVVTMRDGRYCLPVKAEHRASVPGMIHDQSGTGATLFIEPLAVVKLNNDIRALEIKEEREIERILAELSAQAAPYRETIQYNIENLTELDFIFARAGLAMDMNATAPILNEDGIVRLRQARHPLIPAETVVPIDLSLGENFDLLIVTGPNTGGKTVSLKTLGLLCMMGQSGLHIPALDRSTLPVFHEIYADIGDEQSIEQSLSTFSSHMTNTVRILEQADENSLVLFDELGAGTDPVEGAALAIAILSHLHAKGVRTMATTHYSELKLYALQTDGVENASCEFDVSTLRPTYRLLIGVPGKSNAFAISARLGLSDEIIELARSRIDEQDAAFEDVISALEERRITLEARQQALEADRAAIEAARASLDEEKAKLDAERGKLLREANEEARTILQEAKDEADRTIRQLRKSAKRSGAQSDLEKQRSAIGAHLKKTDEKLAAQPAQRTGRRPKTSELKTGTAIKVLSLNLKGTVDTPPDARGNLTVRLGIMRSKVHIDDLELVDEASVISDGVRIDRPNTKRSGGSAVRMEKAAGAGMEINLLGKTVDEAVAALDKFIDDAHIAHLPSVRIIHGKGTGRLREGVHAYLRSHPQVQSFRLAEFGEGDAGVTIATL